MRTSVILFIVLLSGAAIAADNPQPLGSKDQAHDFAETFMRTMASGDTYAAFAMVKAQSPDNAEDTDTLRDSTEQMLDEVRPKLGKPIGYELVGQKVLGESLIRYDYLLKLERFAVHFRIIFYRPQQAWIPSQFWVDQDIRELVDDLGK
ncbi:MAG TPA: hypothetical protein VKK61_04365 [Tepidisphaeraceae bacterium]|jgi:hypothetical protein|nr:hypothetical protein [Tepidisphaeraceae bacterium]